ncbi:Rhomboid-like protein 19 [Orobanche gracilis]
MSSAQLPQPGWRDEHVFGIYKAVQGAGSGVGRGSHCGSDFAFFSFLSCSHPCKFYSPVSGFQGVLSGLLVGTKQIIPDPELSLLKIKAKWLPSIALLVSIGVSFFTTDSTSYLPTLIYDTYIGWIYLRYWQKKPKTNRRGDPSDEFAFSTFFPEFLRRVIDHIATILERLFVVKEPSPLIIPGAIL